MSHSLGKGKHLHCLLCFVHQNLGSVKPILNSRGHYVQGSEGSAAASAPSMQAVRSQNAMEASAAGHNEPHPGELPLPEAQPGKSQPQPEPSGKSAAGAESSKRPGAERSAAASLKGAAASPESAPICLGADQAVDSDVNPPADRLSLSLGVQMRRCRHPKMHNAPAAASMMTRQSPAGASRQSSRKWLEP